MAKSEIVYVPFVGQYLWLSKNIFIDRKNTKNAIDTMKFVSEEMKKKKVKFIMPRMTRKIIIDIEVIFCYYFFCTG